MTQATDELGFEVEILSFTENPQTLIYMALHQCYSDRAVSISTQKISEEECGEIAVRRLLDGGKGHYSPLEHPSISFSCKGFPHSTLQQVTRQRIGVAFSVQSFRYTWKNVYETGRSLEPTKLSTVEGAEGSILSDIFYIRPPGVYRERNGEYEVTSYIHQDQVNLTKLAAIQYYQLIRKGIPPEQARSILPFDYRQHFVVSFNLRSLMHFLDMRGKADAQYEIQVLSKMIFEEAKIWCPEIMEWYEENRWRKGRLAP